MGHATAVSVDHWVGRKDKKEKVVAPWPLVPFKGHSGRWFRNKAELTIAGLVLVHIGTLIIVALYYLCFQTNASVKHAWDHLFDTSWWPYWRHMLRNVYEGILGGTLGQLIVFNHYKKIKPLNWFDKLEIKLHIPNPKNKDRVTALQYLAFPLLVTLYAVPGLLLGAGAVWLGNHGINSAHHVANQVTAVSHVQVVHPSTWARIQSIWTGSVAQKVVGLFASVFLARRVGKKYYDDVQLRFVQRRIALRKSVAFYHTPTFRARFNGINDDVGKRNDSRIAHKTAGWVPALLGISIVVGLALAGFGYYVLAYIAK